MNSYVGNVATVHESVATTTTVLNRAINVEAAELELFFRHYDPVYDGYAAQAGVRSGDLIRGIVTCEVTKRGGVKRKLLRVDEHTSAEEWKELATSCEKISPKGVQILVVMRQLNKTDVDVNNANLEEIEMI